MMKVVETAVVGTIIGLIVALLIPTSFLNPDGIYVPLLAILPLSGAIVGLFIGLLRVMIGRPGGRRN